MSEQNVDVIRRLNAALNAREYSVLEGHIDSEAEFTDHMPLPDVARSAHGPDEMRAVLDAWSHGFPCRLRDGQEWARSNPTQRTL
jgi:hypothetical protein